MAQKVAKARKMKLREEKTFLGQIVIVMTKLTISDKHLQNTDMRRFKIQTGDMPPPPPTLARPHYTVLLPTVSVGRIIYA